MKKAKPETLLNLNKPRRGQTIAYYPALNNIDKETEKKIALDKIIKQNNKTLRDMIPDGKLFTFGESTVESDGVFKDDKT